MRTLTLTILLLATLASATQWEYATLQYTSVKGSSNFSWTTAGKAQLNATSIEELAPKTDMWKAGTKKPLGVIDFLTFAGKDRWELVNVLPNNYRELQDFTTTYYFKRPVQK